MKVAFLTSGGLAPCLTSSIIRMVHQYSKLEIDVDLIGYLHGYKGLLQGQSINIPIDIAKQDNNLYTFGGTFLGNSRIKLTNAEDCIKNGYIKENQIPLEVAANQLVKDDDCSHTT